MDGDFYGGDGALEQLSKSLKDTFSEYPLATGFVIVALLIIVVVMLWRSREQFNPTATMMYQQRSDYGAENYLAGMTPNMSSAQVLASPDFACATRKPIDIQNGGAWEWQYKVASENYENRPRTDNDFSKILAGQ